MKEFISYVLYQIGVMMYGHRKVVSVYFHNPSVVSFEKFVKWAIRKNYTFVSTDDLVRYIKGDLEFSGRVMHVTFDDGWRNNINLIPTIEKFNIPVTIFVAIEPLISGNYWWEFVLKKYNSLKVVENFKVLPYETFLGKLDFLRKNVELSRNAMTVDEVKLLETNPLVDIQSHSFSHPILTSLPDKLLDLEMGDSKMYLENLLSKKINVFSFPNGSYSSREIDSAKKYYECAFTTVSDFPFVGTSLMEIPRIALTDGYWSNLAKILGMWRYIDKIRNICKRLMLKKF